MTGMERNSEVVQLAAYAPLLANINHQGALCPTNLIIYDNHRRGRHPHPPPLCEPLVYISFSVNLLLRLCAHTIGVLVSHVVVPLSMLGPGDSELTS